MNMKIENMEECCFCKEVINKDEHVIIFKDDIMLFICPSCYKRESDTGEIYTEKRHKKDDENE